MNKSNCIAAQKEVKSVSHRSGCGFGSRLRDVRVWKLLSQTELADAAGISQTTVAQIESGRNSGSRHTTAIAKALAVDAYWLEHGGEPAMPMPKRVLSNDYKTGAKRTVKFLRSWQNRDEVAPWDMADQFASLCAATSQDEGRGMRDALFLAVQCAIDGTPPDPRDWDPLGELSNPLVMYE